MDWVPYARAGVVIMDLSPAGSAPQLPAFATAHEEKHIGSLLGDVLDRFWGLVFSHAARVRQITTRSTSSVAERVLGFSAGEPAARAVRYLALRARGSRSGENKATAGPPSGPDSR